MKTPILFLDFDSVFEDLGECWLPGAQREEVTLINALAHGGAIEVRWLSDHPQNWVHMVSSIYGLGRFPCEVREEVAESPMSWWKGAVVVEHLLAGRPVVWCEGGIDAEVAEQFEGEAIGLISPADGLTPRHVDRIREFVDAGCTPDASFSILERDQS